MQKLVRELNKLPSIGEKTAMRLAMHLVNNEELVASLSMALVESADSISLCQKCFFLTENEHCIFCENESRTSEVLCVVEKPMDLIAIERVGEFKGLYHVLHGAWSPLKGQGTSSLKIDELVERTKEEGVKEIILATSSTVEGDATALYIARLLQDQGISTTRLAQGVPKGGELEYLDEITLSRALQGRATL